MNYFEKFNAQKEKLTTLLDEHHLLHTFQVKNYPMSLTVSVNQAPGEQIALYEQAGDDGVSSRDAKLVLTFPVGEIGVRTHGRLVVSDALMNKIKNIGKKMRDLYLQADYASRIEEKKRLQNEQADEEDTGEDADE